MAYTRLCCLLLTVVGLTLSEDVNFKVVKLDQGLVKGYKSTEGNFFVFYGIPYATAPTGPNKFKAPLPAPTWTETLEAVNKDISCPQTPLFISSGQQEDCLIANIFVPSTLEKTLPVIVYVHGGAYSVGKGNMAPPYPMVNEGKFIVVNFNYRLGVHGFLCLGTEDAPGNAGMKDQLALLRWVQRNIENFGGDPSDVTISGASAGASAVELLMLSETTKGLFNKVISDSGNAISVWSVQIDPVENAKRYARLHNLTTNDIKSLEEFYKKASYEQLVAYDFLRNEKDSVFVFVPCVERETDAEIFLKRAPVDIIKDGNFSKVPLLIGFTNMEGLFRAHNFEQWKIEMNENFADFLPADLQFENAEEKVKVANEVKHFYFGAKKISEETILGYLNYFTDVTFAYPALRTVKLLVESGNADVYLYQYSYSDNFTVSNRLFPQVGGADHASQCITMVNVPPPFQDDSFITESYKKMKNVMRKLWTNFILTGQPITSPTPDHPKGWPASSAKRSPYMELNIPSELKEFLLSNRAQFWDQIYEKHYRNPVAPSAPAIGHSEL